MTDPARVAEPAAAAAPPRDPAAQLLDLATAYMASACLGAAAHLKIADALAAGPQTAAQLAASAKVNEDALYRVLRALASAGVFREISPRTFANTPMSEAMAQGDRSLRDLVLWLAGPLHFHFYSQLLYSVRTGENAVKKLTGMEPFVFLQEEKVHGDLFNAAMTSFSAACIAAVLEAYDFSGLGTFADIAGGHGMLISAILRKHPNLKGILFDQPHVVSGAGAWMEMEKSDQRFRIVAGDFFRAVPPADNYVMKQVIHDWDDERAAAILRNCASAMLGRGKVILLESVIAPGNEPQIAKWMDIEMLLMPSGRERSEAEFASLLSRAGLRLARVVPTRSLLCVIEAVKD